METCSELNYNNYSDYYDEQAETQPHGYNQQWQNGESYDYDAYSQSNSRKALPQPPTMSYSQSVNDVHGHRYLVFSSNLIHFNTITKLFF